MRKAQKRQAEEFTALLEQAHREIRRLLEAGSPGAAQDLLVQCQEGAVQLGELVEKTEGEGCAAVPLLEDYCELAYNIHGELAGGGGANNVHKRLHRQLIRIRNSIRNDIRLRYEMVFLPYKAAMWDSLESVWQAAEADPDCDAYVIPIPYYDRNPDGSLGTYHYEGDGLPPYVPVVHYDSYPFGDRKPDAIYIHTPYDDANRVTTIDPRFYSGELKKYTECLVYIPYYATSGGMAEGQARCPAYYNADYIIIQAEKYRRYFDPALPQGKLVPLGSPKFDRVIRMCADPPLPPAGWGERMAGRKVYFYNTSLQGMLGNTEAFLKKMEYVFRTFRGRGDVCLLWRPHPLMESTFESMRPMYKPMYDALRDAFIREGLGIYDDTPDITATIALCDAYIGDAATSVTSLFGIAGKPLFILNNAIHSAPGEEDWRREVAWGFRLDFHDKWLVTQGNHLYYSPDCDYRYKHYCKLSEYGYGGYYIQAIEIRGKVYVCPGNAQDILVVADGKVERRITLERRLEQAGAFGWTWETGQYLYLLPIRYPAIVRYDTHNDKVEYIRGYNDIFTADLEGQWRMGGSCIWKGCLYIASPTDNRVLALDCQSGKARVISVECSCIQGCMGMIADGDDIWMLPYSGKAVTRWNPETGETREYKGIPETFRCVNIPYGFECGDRPFNWAACQGNQVFLSPCWGDRSLVLDKETGSFQEWKPPFEDGNQGENGYYGLDTRGFFSWPAEVPGDWTHRFFHYPERRLYDVNLETGKYREVNIEFDMEELRNHEPGFCKDSQWLQYACKENAINSLGGFLEGKVSGRPFDREAQIRDYGQIAANHDGTCGVKVYRFVKELMP